MSQTPLRRLHTVLLNPRKAVKRFPHVVPKDLTCKSTVAVIRHNTYQQNLAGCTVFVKFQPGTVLIEVLGPRQTIGSARLVWHHAAAKVAWRQITAKYKDGTTRLLRFMGSKWQRPAGLPRVAISLSKELVENDQNGNEIAMASALLVCISHSGMELMEQVVRLANPGNGIPPRQPDLAWKLASPFCGLTPVEVIPDSSKLESEIRQTRKKKSCARPGQSLKAFASQR